MRILINKKSIMLVLAFLPAVLHNAQADAHEQVRFSSLLDNCLQIWEEASSLLGCNDPEQCINMHDLLVGRLMRLSRDISRLEKENADSNSVLVSDLDYLLSILVALENEFDAGPDQADEHDSITQLARSIRSQISQLL